MALVDNLLSESRILVYVLYLYIYILTYDGLLTLIYLKL